MIHPFKSLSRSEVETAREVILNLHPDEVIVFREIYLQEPPKSEVLAFLELEHSGKLTSSSKPPARLAKCQYDVIGKDKVPAYNEAFVDLNTKERVHHEVVGTEHHASLTVSELRTLVEVCQSSKLFKDAIAEFDLPDNFEIIIEPWPYGGLDNTDENLRYFQGLIFAQDSSSGNPDSNFYAFPLPLIPIMDAHKREIIRIDRLATGGKKDGLYDKTYDRKVLEHCKPAEYVPELVPGGTRKTLKPLHVVQPEGPSFDIDEDSLVEWQNWSFRVSFNAREGAVLHDVRFAGRSVLYRLSISEMTVPYGDARPPYHRKQAFDFGDGGAGNCANNLALGCDCLGVIKYFDAVSVDSDGKVQDHPNVVCLHEQDNGILWKHTNWRTGRAVVTRRRELVVQFIITLANYEYIFAYKFDQAGGIDIETRATGIVSAVHIDPGKTSDYGNVLNPGVLAQNHQHIFALRIDPAVDGQNNTITQEESLTIPMNDITNPKGNAYKVVSTPIEQSCSADLSPQTNRIFKIINENKTNPISGRNVGYKLISPPTQLLLADRDSIQARRAAFAQHHMWFTPYHDNELYAAGRFTMQSRQESGGVADMVRRGEALRDKDVVVWAVFGLTHNPRTEDWPVMPVEIHTVSLRPADFFESNPALDVPASKDGVSQLYKGGMTNGECCANGDGHANGVNGHGADTNGHTEPITSQ
ncbi:putative copper amine oxidase [Piedraia hortae CBS 480.64]|uniref:Amine oxidase n=1 Tax=Piedraia hortae CBS 480.64 TaxID=1314780 RepID=A0A6A7C7Z6_9PEZI|nr:putative copper amine oxidase [Piedraia hortae CBS 480.64]